MLRPASARGTFRSLGFRRVEANRDFRNASHAAMGPDIRRQFKRAVALALSRTSGYVPRQCRSTKPLRRSTLGWRLKRQQNSQEAPANPSTSDNMRLGRRGRQQLCLAHAFYDAYQPSDGFAQKACECALGRIMSNASGSAAAFGQPPVLHGLAAGSVHSRCCLCHSARSSEVVALTDRRTHHSPPTKHSSRNLVDFTPMASIEEMFISVSDCKGRWSSRIQVRVHHR